MAEEGYKKIFWEILLTSVKYSDALTHFPHSPHCCLSSMTRAFLSRRSSCDSAIDRACLDNFSAVSPGDFSAIARPCLEHFSPVDRAVPRPLLERAPAFLGRPSLGHRSSLPRAFPSRRSSMTRPSLDHASAILNHARAFLPSLEHSSAMLEHARAFLSRRSSMPRPAMEHASAILYHARAFLGHARACSSISLPSLEHASAMLDARAFLSRRSSISLPCSIISLPSLEHASAALTFSHEPSTHYFTSLDLLPPWFLTF